MDTNPPSGRKRARLFGNDPIPGVVFSLDTSKKKLPLDLFNPSCAQQSKPAGAAGGKIGGALPADSEGETPGSISSVVSVGASTPDINSSGALAPCYTAIGSASPAAKAVTTPTTLAVGIPAAAVEAVEKTPVETRVIKDTLPVTSAAAGSPTNRPIVQKRERQSPSLHDAHADTAITATPAASAEPCKSGPPWAPSTTEPVGPHQQETNARTGVVENRMSAAVTTNPPTKLDTQGTPLGDGDGGRDAKAGPAASMVASFLKRGSTLPPPAAGKPSPADRPHSVSPPKTPTPLASIVAGVPPGSGGSSSGGNIRVGRASYAGERRQTGDRTPNAGGLPGRPTADSRIHSPRRGSNRFLHEDWPPVLKKRRRILYYNPRSSAPAGSRIVYWIRGNLRVKDNQALSVAMWLSTELRLPLQAVTFVDPAIGMSLPLRPPASGSVKRTSRSSGRDNAQRGAAKQQELPLRMAVQASGLCEMEQALRAFNVPLVAIACAEGEIPSTLACWCSGRDWGGTGRDESAPAWTPAASGSPTAAAAGATAVATTPGSPTSKVAAQGLPTEESVRIVIMDESYHPRQLSLSTKVKDALRGTAALYAVDSSSAYAINTGVGAANKSMSPEEFRRAQEESLPIVLGELTPRPRLPLEPQMQNQVFGGSDERAMLPHAFEQRTAKSSAGSAVVVDWSGLREASARRFPGFGKPVSRQLTSSTKDLIPFLGGGERVGKAALEQTLDTAVASSAPDNLRPTGAWTGLSPAAAGDHGLRSQPPQQPPPPPVHGASLEREVAGLGFGGCLLHLLRLGSLSTLSVVQALFQDLRTGAAPDQGGGKASEMCDSRRQILEAVLSREYALYRSRLYHREMESRSPSAALAASTRGGFPSAAAAKGQEWRGKDLWMAIVPAWVWEELTKGQRDARQHLHSPWEIRLAGLKVPSTVDDDFFSAIQERLTNGGRLFPSLAPYWARAVVKMMLSPPQAVSFLIRVAEEFSLGAEHAGDIIPDLLDCAFGVLRELPPSPTGCAGTSPGHASGGRRQEIPVFRRLSHPPLATEEGLRLAFEGQDALARFLAPFAPPPVPTSPPPAS